MPHVSRFYFSNIGPEAAYLRPQVQEILPDGRRDLSAFTTVQLPNGGGKTTMISLILAIFEPNADRFLAKLRKDQAAERSFDSYLSEKGGASIVACEMIVPIGFAEEKRLVCGYCAARPSNQSSTWRNFFVFETLDGTRDLMALMPGVGGDETEVLTTSDFSLWCGRMEGRGVEFQSVNRQRDWRSLLVSRKVDVDMMRLLVQANLTESDPTVGILTSRKEIDFLASVLGKVMSGEELEAKHQAFVEASVKIQDREGKAQLLERHKELSGRIDRFAREAGTTRGLRAQVEAGRERIRDAIDAAEATRLALAAQSTALEAEMREERAALAEAARIAQETEAAREAAEHQVLTMELAEIEGRHGGIVSAMEANAAERTAIELAGVHRALAVARGELEAVEATLSKGREDVAPFQDAADAALRVLGKSIRNAMSGAEERLATAEAALVAAEADRTRLRRAKAAATARLKTLDAEEGRIEGELRSAARERARLVERDVLSGDEMTEHALRRVDEAVGRATDRLAGIEAEAAKARDGSAKAARDRTALEGERRLLVGKQASLAALIEEAVSLRDDMDRDRLARRILETDAIDPDSDHGLGVLEGLASTRRADHVAREQEIAAYGRAIDSIDRWDVAVPNPDVEAALRDLEASGFDEAQPFGRWLADEASPEDALRLASTDPGRLAGLHVPDHASLERATEILRRRQDVGMLSPLVVSVGFDGVPWSDPEKAVVLPATAAGWSREAAALVRSHQNDDKEALEQESARFAREAESLADTCGRIKRWRAKFGAGLHADHVAEREAVNERLSVVEADIEACGQALAAAQERIARLQDDRAGLTTERARLVSAAQDIRALAATEKAAAPLRDRLIGLRSEQAEARQAEERAGKADDAMAGPITDARVRISNAKGERANLKAEIGGLGAIPEAGEATPLVGLAAARQAHETALENLRRTSEAAFGETQFRRDALIAQIRRAETDAARLADKPGMDEALARRLADGGRELVDLAEELVRIHDEIARQREQATDERGQARQRLAAFEQAGRRQPAIAAPEAGDLAAARANRSARALASTRAAEALAILSTANQQRSQDAERLQRHLSVAEYLGETILSDLGIHGIRPEPGRGMARPAAELDTVKADYVAAKKALTEARAAAERSDQRCRETFEDVRRYVSQEQFQRMEPIMSVHILTADYDAAFEGSDGLHAMILDRIACVADELAGLDRAVQTAVDLMAPFVSDALRMLKLATEFRIPATSPVLPGKQVMLCRQSLFSVTEAVRRQDIGDQLVRMAHTRTVPADGAALLAALCNSIAGENLGIKILKINTVDSGEYQPFEAMMHSGGQYMAASMMMFALIASLRAKTAGNHHSGRTATLIMDNPFGKLSFDEFWVTVLCVMKALGVQIIAYTGKPDRVTSLFPGMVLCKRNRTPNGPRITITAANLVWEQREAA